MSLSIGVHRFLALSLSAPAVAAAQSFQGPTAAPPAAIAFGGAVAVAGDQVLVGRPGLIPGFPTPPSQAGAVHLFRRTSGRWVESESFAASDSAVGDGFGIALAADGGLLAVGAAEAAERRGAVYLFERDRTGRWAQRARLSASAGAAGDQLGTVVALRDGVLLAGAPGDSTGSGKVVVFRRGKDAATWTEQAVLQPSGLDAGHRFGIALALERGRALVGAPGPGGNDSTRWRPGAAYVFRLGAGGWVQEAVLRVVGDSSVHGAGRAVLLDGAGALVAAPTADSLAGRVYRFRRGGNGRWVAAGIVAPATPERPALFGATLARDGADLLVGSPITGHGAGAVHVLRRKPGSSDYAEVQQFTTELTGFGNQLGSALAAAGGVAAAGAPSAYFGEGQAHVYRREGAGAREGAAGRWRDEGMLADTLGPGLPAVTTGEVSCQAGKARAFECKDADLVSYLPSKAIGAGRGVLINDIWGWTDSTTGREFALVGRTDGTAFVEVTDPAKPVFLGSLPLTLGARSNIWRDIKVYQNHAFIVADGAGPHGMQVFDLTELRQVQRPPVTFKESAHYDQIYSAHNIVIDTATGYAYTVGNSMGGETCGGALHMVDIRDPDHPVFAGCYADTTTGNARTGYTHDAQCVRYHGPDAQYRGREICFNSSETALGIADVSNKRAPKPISTAAYPNVGYTHQGWLSEDQRWFYLDDELDELQGHAPHTRTLVFDVSDLDDPVVAKEFFGSTAATDHNLYVRGHYVYQSDYVAGLRVLDIKDPANPVEVSYFDTVPYGENAPGFAGSWSNYPFFKSGVVAVTSMREGLFMIRPAPRAVIP